MPRVAPITGKSDVPAEYHDVVDGVLQVFGQVRGPFSMLLHSPKLAERVLNLGNFFRSNDSVVAAKDRSLAILVAAREREGAYVWAAQVAAARRAGVREEAIDSSVPRETQRSFPPKSETSWPTPSNWSRRTVSTRPRSMPSSRNTTCSGWSS